MAPRSARHPLAGGPAWNNSHRDQLTLSRWDIAWRFAMERRITAGAMTEAAGTRWRVERPLGADAVLLRNDAGEIVTAAPSTISFPEENANQPPLPPIDELQYTETEWAEATRRRDVLIGLARQSSRTREDVDRAAR